MPRKDCTVWRKARQQLLLLSQYELLCWNRQDQITFQKSCLMQLLQANGPKPGAAAFVSLLGWWCSCWLRLAIGPSSYGFQRLMTSLGWLSKLSKQKCLFCWLVPVGRRCNNRSFARIGDANDLPVVETYQGAGVISRDLEEDVLWTYRILPQQVGDQLLAQSV